MNGLRARRWSAAIAGVVAVVLLWVRAPFAPRNFWAEDGKLLFAQAMEDGWIEAITNSNGGYFLFLPRLLGPVAMLGPLEIAPRLMFVMCAFVVGWFAATIVFAGERYFDRLQSRVALALLPVLLPIIGFDVIGGFANLHFLMLCPAAAVLVGDQGSRGRQVNDVVLVTMAGLTSPLTVSLAPLVALRMWWDRRGSPRRSIAPVVIGWAVGITVHLAMIFIVAEDRELVPDRSIFKAGFLFLERVLLYNLLPFWPSVSNEDATGGIDGELVVRALVGLALTGLLVVAAVVSGSYYRREGRRQRSELVLALPVVGTAMFLAASMLSGSEPRYAVFPAFCFVWMLLMVRENSGGLGRIRGSRRLVGAVISVSLLASVVTHWMPSSIRRTGPKWATGLEAAVVECSADPKARVDIPILPEGWTVALDCSELLDR